MVKLGFTVYDEKRKGQAPYRRSDLLKLHIYGYLNKIRSSRCLEVEAKRNLELMWLVNAITPDHGTIAGFVQKNKVAFHNVLRDLTLILKGWGLIEGKLVAIDGTNHFAIDAVVTNDINDLNQLSTMATDVKGLVEPDEMAVIADTGYYNAPEIKKCVDTGMAVYIKKGKSNNTTKDSRYRKEEIVYDPERDVYICPEGITMPFFKNTSKNGMKYWKYKCTACERCPKKSLCTKSTSGRRIQRWEHEAVLEKVCAETEAHNNIYEQRRCIVEHPFGTIKRQLGYTFFLRKGIENVDAECASKFIAYNLKRLFGILSVTELKKKFETCRV